MSELAHTLDAPAAPPDLAETTRAGRAAYEKWFAKRPKRDDREATAVVECAAPGTPCPRGNLWHPSCKRRDCRVCGSRWIKNVYTVVRSALEALGRPVTVIAITPPGQERLPWDTERCTHGAGAKCSGPKYGCRVQERALREWSETLTWRAAKLRKAAYMALRRSGLTKEPPRWLERIWEPQKRGPAHLHIVLPYGTFVEKRVAKAYVAELRRLAPRHDFGHVDAHLKSWTALEAARYLTAYLTGRSSKRKSTMRANLGDPNLPPSLFWVSPRLTAVTHVTMRSLRRARHVFAWRKAPQEVDEPKWSTSTEAVKAVAAFRRVILRKTPPPGGDDDVNQALVVAACADAQLRELEKAVDRHEPYSWGAWFTQRERVREFASVLAAHLLPAPEPQAALA